MVVFFVKINENTYPKGRALMQMYRIVPQTKRGNCPGYRHLRIYWILITPGKS